MRLYAIKTWGAIAALILFLAFTQFQSPFIHDWDGYYHIKFADLMRHRGILHDFSWASLGLWSHGFSDKDFLYHLYLVPFTYLPNLTLGVKLATLLLQCLTAGSFLAILRAQGVRWTFGWTAVLCVGSQIFLYRMGMNRSVLVSVMLSLWVTHFAFRRRYFAVFLLSLVYALSYTAFHLAPLLCLLVVGAARLEGQRFEVRLPLASAAGCLVGMFLHPNFPANFEMFYVQNFLVLFSAVGGRAVLETPSELAALGTREFLSRNALTLLVYVAGLYLCLWRGVQRRSQTRTLFLLSAAFLCLSGVSLRFLEYAVPFCTWFAAAAFQDFFGDEPVLDEGGGLRGVALALIALILIVSLGARNTRSAWADLRLKNNSGRVHQEPFARYLVDHARPGDIVFTCRWSDAGPLFFYNDRQRYLIFLDPFFLEYRDKDRAWSWREIEKGYAKEDTYRILRDRFGASWGFCSKDSRELLQWVRKDPRMNIVMEKDEFFLFQVPDEPAVPIPLAENT